MSRRDRPEPLWASSLADQRQPHDDVIVRVLEEEPEERGERPAPPPKERRPARLAPGLLAALPLAALVIALEGDGPAIDLPSYWGDVPMTCKTLRLERNGRAGEWFGCRALAGGRLPAGLYTPPESNWRSDVTRRSASDSRIRITRDGEVRGWALYEGE